MNRLKEKWSEAEVDFNSEELSLTLTQLKALRELNPPKDVLPNGNVGTPSEVFLQLIRGCRLPPQLITKLSLEFPKSMRKRIYSNVEYKYTDNKNRNNTKYKVYNQLNTNSGVNSDLDLVKTRNGLVINETFSDFSKSCVNTSDKRVVECDEDSDEAEVEEWDRYETLHDDVTEQERTKQRVFEEEVELKWEKGGSGLVFYTDQQFWELNENCGDFDEKTADDWDLDLNIYRKNCSADKESNDLKTLTDEMKLREGNTRDNIYQNFIDSINTNNKRKNKKVKKRFVFKEIMFYFELYLMFCFNIRKSDTEIGCFEKHTKGFGRKIMESQGWTPGQGLGQTFTGIPEPIEDCGQSASDKRGFGYRGQKLNSFQFKTPEKQ